MRAAAHIVSYILHPLMMPTIIFALLLFHYPYLMVSNEYFKFALLIMIFLMTGVLPALCIFLMYKFRIISSLYLKNREERIYPFLMTLMIYFSASYFLYTEPLFDKLFSITLIMITLAIIVLTIITRVWKISAHAIGIGGLTGFVLRMNLVYKDDLFLQLLAVLVLFSGIVLSARIFLNAHTPNQAYAGYLLGVFMSFLSYPWAIMLANQYA